MSGALAGIGGSNPSPINLTCSFKTAATKAVALYQGRPVTSNTQGGATSGQEAIN